MKTGRSADVHKIQVMARKKRAHFRINASLRQKVLGQPRADRTGFGDGDDAKMAVLLPSGQMTMDRRISKTDDGTAQGAQILWIIRVRH